MVFVARIILFLSLFVAFLVSAKLPDGVFTAKELGLYAVSALSVLLAFVVVLKRPNQRDIYVHPVDLLVVGYLVLLPFIQLLCFHSIATPAVWTQMAYGSIYVAFRVVSAWVRPATLVNTVTEVFTVVLCFQLAIAFAQHLGLMPSYHPMFGATGMFFNPGPFAIFTASLMAFVLVTFYSNLSKKWRGIVLFQGLLLTVGAYFIMLSLSRSAWVGLFAGLLAVATAYVAVRFKAWIHVHRRKLFVSGLFCLPLLALAGAWLYNLKSDSADGRVLVWLSSTEMVKDNWHTGVGIGNFAPRYVHYQAEYLRSSDAGLERFGHLAGDSRYAFNDLLQAFAESGVVGAVLLTTIASMVIGLFWKGFRQKFSKPWAVIGSCGLAFAFLCILVAGFTAYPLQMLPISILFWLLVALSVTLFGEVHIRLPPTWKYLLAFSLFSGAAFYGYTAVIRAVAYRGWVKEASLPSATGALDGLLLWYPVLNSRADYLSLLAQRHRELDDLPKATQYLKDAIKRNPAKVYYYALGECHEATGDTASALACYRLIGSAIPNLLEPRYREAMLYHRLGDAIMFKIKAEDALSFTPKIQNTETVIMQDKLRLLLKEAEHSNAN